MKDETAFEKTTTRISFLSGILAVIVTLEKWESSSTDPTFKLIYGIIGIAALLVVMSGAIKMTRELYRSIKRWFLERVSKSKNETQSNSSLDDVVIKARHESGSEREIIEQVEKDKKGQNNGTGN